MELSLFRSLSTAIGNNLTSLKRQSKRLHKASPRIFGKEYPLTVCQEAVAAAHGLPSWLHVGKLLARAGIDREKPFWHQDGRNDRHQQLLHAIYTLELSALTNDAVIVRGDINSSLEVGLCLWLEEMSSRQRPGLLLIETDAEAIQDTPVWQAAQSLGQNQLLDQFRFIDTRERRLPGALLMDPISWAEAVECGLPDSMRHISTKSWFRTFCELAILVYGYEYHANNPSLAGMPAGLLKHVAMLLKHPDLFLVNFLKLLSSTNRINTRADSFEVDMHLFLQDCPADVRDELCTIMTSMADIIALEGVDLIRETRHRPTVVLFCRSNPVSVALASTIEIEVARRSCGSRDSSFPIFYANCGEHGYLLPSYLCSTPKGSS
jgi:hypothetical protein